jgi:hypothetical protein
LQETRTANQRHRTLVTALLVLLVAVLGVTPTATGQSKKGPMRVDLKKRHLGDSEADRFSDGDFFSGRMKLTDNFISESNRTFRNRPGAGRKRLYRLEHTLQIRFKEGFAVLGITCKTKMPRGTFALSNRRGTRAFYPRPELNLEPVTEYSQIGIGIRGLSLQLPFHPVTNWVSSSLGPNVAWTSTLSSTRQGWEWTWDDGRPREAQVSFVGHWAGPAEGLSFKTTCFAQGLDGDGAFPTARVKIEKSGIRA